MRDNPVVEPTAERGDHKLFLQEVTQADKGVDFAFLKVAQTEWKDSLRAVRELAAA